MRKWSPILLALAIVLSIVLPGPWPRASAASVTLNPVADTDTQSDVAAGTNATLYASQWNNLFVKFNLTGLSAVANVTVRIYHTSHSTNHTLTLYGASTESWSEGGAKPSLGSAIASRSVTGDGYVEFDVTAAVQSKLAAGGTSLTLGFATDLSTWEAYQSRESANKPELVVTSNPAPVTQTLNPVADTDTQSDVAAGTNATLNVSEWNNLFAKFNLAGLTSVTSATVRIYHTSHSSNHTLTVYGASTESWSEGGAKPSLGSAIASRSVTGDGYVEFDVTAAVQSKLASGGTSLTLGFATNLSTWEAYLSRESAHKPELVVASGSGGGSGNPGGGGSMKIGTNFWFLAPSWSGETPFKANVDWSTAYAQGADIWNPTFIGELAPYSVLRFMDWGATNNSKVQTWSQRRQPNDPGNGDIGYIDASSPLTPGLAYEWMIDLANRTGKDMWVNLPHLTDNNYANQLAQLIKTKLNPNLKVYVEYSNETWNGSFSQFQYTLDQGTAQGLPGSNQWYQGGAFSLYRSVQIWQQFANVFGSEMSSRVVRVAAFSGNYDIFDQGYDNVVNSTTWNPSGQKADMIAISPYVGSELDGADSNIQSEFHQEIDAVFADRVLPAVDLAQKYNVKLGTYEGGQHLLTNSDLWSANQNIYTEYQYMLNKFAPYFVLFNHYTNAGNWTSGGAWGAKAYTGQPAADAPKYRALADWAAAHP